jgi:hypothetical protein
MHKPIFTASQSTKTEYVCYICVVEIVYTSEYNASQLATHIGQFQLVLRRINKILDQKGLYLCECAFTGIRALKLMPFNRLIVANVM